MKTIIKSALITSLAFATINAVDHTNQTFMMSRPTLADLPMEYTSFNELISRKDEAKFGGNFQAVAFYKNSLDGQDFGKAFLVNHKNPITFRASPTNDNKVSTVCDVDLFYIIHQMGLTTQDQANAAVGNTTLELNPEEKTYGIRLDYHQDLDRLIKGLYLKTALAIVHVRHDAGLKICSNVTMIKDALEKYFKGEFEGFGVGNMQEKLTNAKIKPTSFSSTGVADIDMALGYKFFNRETYYAGLALAITLPTGNEAHSAFMFEPLHGNGNHFALGGDLFMQCRLLGDIDHNLTLYWLTKYRYLFKNIELRTAGLKNRNWGQYYLLNVTGREANGKLIPAANITTKHVEVTPGSQYDGIWGLAYNVGNVSLDFGYDMFFKESESLTLKDKFCDNKYAIAARNLNTVNANVPPAAVPQGTPIPPFNPVDVDGDDLVVALINLNTIDFVVAETPSVFTHALYGALGYVCKEWDAPLMFGLGGKYEITTDNSALGMWEVWGKFGFGF